MNAKNARIEIYGGKLSVGKGYFPSLVNRSLLILLFGSFFLSAMTIPTYMSFQTAMQLLEPAKAEHLQSLATDLYPTAYLTQGKITTTGVEASRVVICDAASVHLLYGNNPALSLVELIKITASSPNDLPTSMDLTKLEELTSLKYLLVEFEYDACVESAENCFSSILQVFIMGKSSQITVMYSHSISQ